MTRSPTELEPEIEASRQALAADVAALKERAAPRRLMGDAVEKARERGRQAGARLLKTATSDAVWASVIGGGIIAGVTLMLVRRRRAARRDTVAANVARATEPMGAVFAAAAAWLLARRRRAARRDTVAAVLARAAAPIDPLLRRVSPRRNGLRAFLTLPRS